jgi:hypothetical protein
LADIIEEISLNILRPTQFVSVRLQQGSYNIRKINVTIYNGNEIYTIPTNTLINLRMIKPDGEPILDTCSLTNNKVQFTVTQQMTTISGRCSAKIEIIDSALGTNLKTVKFHVLIDEDPLTDDMAVSTGEFTALQAALLEAGDISNKVDKSHIANNFVTTDETFVAAAPTVKTLYDNLASKILTAYGNTLAGGTDWNTLTEQATYDYQANLTYVNAPESGAYGIVEVITIGCSAYGSLCDPDMRIWSLPNAEAVAAYPDYLPYVAGVIVIGVVVSALIYLVSKKR